MKTSLTLSYSLLRGAQLRIPGWSHSRIITEHRPHTMDWEMSWEFLVAILKGDLWEIRDAECVCVCVDMTGRNSVYVSQFPDQDSPHLQVRSGPAGGDEITASTASSHRSGADSHIKFSSWSFDSYPKSSYPTPQCIVTKVISLYQNIRICLLFFWW
jgi:hypothetical protein